MSKLRDKLLKKIIKHQRSECDCKLCTEDRDFVTEILQAIRKELPKKYKVITEEESIYQQNEEGRGWALGWNAYRDEMIKKL